MQHRRLELDSLQQRRLELGSMQQLEPAAARRRDAGAAAPPELGNGHRQGDRGAGAASQPARSSRGRASGGLPEEDGPGRPSAAADGRARGARN